MKKIKICMMLMFVITCFSTITFAANFYDTKGTIYEGVVNRVARLGIINGVTDTAFAPNKSLTRAELAKMLVYTKGLDNYAKTYELKSDFKDVKGHWAESYIAVATELGILKGYEDGTFKPDKEVSYAEVVTILIRMLGYVNIDETQGDSWYFGYTKRMYEIDLDKGLPKLTNIDAPARRGDVAILWWNMLVSDKWVIVSEGEVSGMYYTYSTKTQLEALFPNYTLVKGNVKGMSYANSGDDIIIEIGNIGYQTDSPVSIHALGGTAVGVYDPKTKKIYGVSVDDDLEEFSIVSGPIFYLESLGYKLKSAKRESSYGSKASAKFAYLFVSKETGEIQRVVYVDASDSWYIDSIKVESQKKDNSNEKNNEEPAIYNVYINNNDNILTTSRAAIIKNGKIVTWNELKTGVVLTELIPNKLYTYEDAIISGKVTNYKDLNELHIDYDKYLVANNCVYKIFGEKTSDGKTNNDSSKYHNYQNKMKKALFEELLTRDIKFHLNIAEEITMIEYGKYKPNNIIEKYDNSELCFFYVNNITYPYRSGDNSRVRVAGRTLGNREVKYEIENGEDIAIGDLLLVQDFEGKLAKKFLIIQKNIIVEDDDIMVLYDVNSKFNGHSFGEYTLTNDTLIFNVKKNYKDNSNKKVQECTFIPNAGIENLGDLSKCRIVLLCNTNMDIDAVFVERELNKTAYPIGKVIEVNNYYDDASDNLKIKARIIQLGGRSETYILNKGDCFEGELVTFAINEEESSIIKIKERFDTIFIGYEKDLVVKSFDKDNKMVEIEGASEKLDLRSSTYNYNGKEYDLLAYRYVLAETRYDEERGKWIFTKTTLLEKEDLELQPNDRIAFGELNAAAIIYRGYSK